MFGSSENTMQNLQDKEMENKLESSVHGSCFGRTGKYAMHIIHAKCYDSSTWLLT